MGHLLRSQHHGSYGGGGGTGGGGGREDCWTEEATAALIEVWGERFVELNRGNLRQKDWKDVAMAVNEHLAAMGKPRKTDIQCKNRIDTLKKKFKLEKSKPGSSRWGFFSRLEELICPEGDIGVKKEPGSSGARDPPLTFTIKRRSPRNANPNHDPDPAVLSEGSFSRSKANSSPVSSESSRGDAGGANNGGGAGEVAGNGLFHGRKVFSGRKRQWGSSLDIDRLIGGVGGGGEGGVGVDGAFRELAKAIMKFGEIYEKVENSKQQQMLELERQRMEFAKELEFQRMQMFMEAQLELEKMKRPKYSAASGKQM